MQGNVASVSKDEFALGPQSSVIRSAALFLVGGEVVTLMQDERVSVGSEVEGVVFVLGSFDEKGEKSVYGSGFFSVGKRPIFM